MIVRRRLFAVLAALPALGLAARAAALEPPRPIERSRWLITAIDRVPVENDPTRGPPYIEFQGAQFHAFNGCNFLNGSFTHGDGRLTIGDWSTTKRACHGRDGELERLVNTRLKGELSWRLEGDTVILAGPAGSLTLVGRPKPAK